MQPSAFPSTVSMVTEANLGHVDSPVVLVIDDDPLVSVVVRRALGSQSHRLHTAFDGQAGVREVEAQKPDLIVLDNLLPDGLGVDVLTQIHAIAPSVPVLFVTARGSGSTVIEAMKLSAFDYLPKPLEPAKLRRQIQRALSMRRLLSDEQPELPRATGAELADQTESEAPQSERPAESPDALVGECPAMQVVFKSIGKVATQDVAVLLRGEHGTGKEAIAREIHRHSQRSDKPFVRLHCPGLDESRLEAELFGGGPLKGSPGRIAEAGSGALLLQEIGRLPLSIQGKLLQALRDGEYEPVGAGQTEEVRCRILAITSEDLEALVRAGKFRSDLYYALSSFVITLPPLRQRRGDLPLLISHTLRKLHAIYEGLNIDRPIVSEEAMQALCNHVWPGNIDELESVLKRALVEQKGHILLASDLHTSLAVEPVVGPGDSAENQKHMTDWAAFTQLRVDAGVDTIHSDAVAETEKKLFSLLLRHTRGNQSQAARLLGITRASLRKKLRQYGMDAQQPDE